MLKVLRSCNIPAPLLVVIEIGSPYGPTPTLVMAATETKYVVPSSTAVTSSDSFCVSVCRYFLNDFLSVTLTLYPMILPFCASSGGWLQLNANDDLVMLKEDKLCGAPLGTASKM